MAAKTVSVTNIGGLNKVMRSLRQLGTDATRELREESAKIASDLIVPAYANSARTAGGWGDKLAASVRVKRDRIPAVQIGYARKVFSGGASTIMLRYPTSSGRAANPRIPGYGWIREAEIYKVEAMQRWTNVIDNLIRKYDREPDL